MNIKRIILLIFIAFLFIQCKTIQETSVPEKRKMSESWPFECDPELETPFIGINIDPWRFSLEAGEIYSYDDVNEIFSQAKTATGAEIVRLHLHGYAFEPSVGNYNEAAFIQLDTFIKAANDNNMQVLIALRDYIWGPWPPSSYDPYWSYGSQWSIGQEDPLDPAPNKDAILKVSEAIDAYKNFLYHTMTRENSLTGETYANDPGIWGWVLINEPNTEKGILKPWIDNIGAYLKTLTDIPVGVALPGVEPSWWSSGSDNWNELDSPQLDFIAIHYYADSSLYEGIPDAKNIAAMRDRFRAAQNLGKPVYLTEFGCINTTDSKTRSNLYSVIMSVAMEEGIKGLFPYSWGPPGPVGWGGPGSFCVTQNDKDICNLLKVMSENN